MLKVNLSSTMMFHLVMLACLAPAAYSDSHCSNPLPGSQDLFRGVDVSTFDMYADNVFKLPIIPMTCNEGKTKWIVSGRDQFMYEMPDQVSSHRPISIGHWGTDTRVIETMSDVTDSFSVGVAVSGGYGPVTASVSTDYSQMQQDLATNKFFYSIAESEMSTADITLKSPMSKSMNMAEGPARTLSLITDNFESKPGPYLDFINVYGTHYLSEGVFGAVIRAEIKTESSLLEQYSTKDLEVAAELKYAGVVNSASISSTVTTSSSKASTAFNEKSSISVSYYGGDPNIAKDDIDEWQPTVFAHPHIRAGTLSKISDLITGNDKLKEQLEIAVDYYLRGQLKSSIVRTIRTTGIHHQRFYQNRSPLNKFADDIESGVYDSKSFENIQSQFDVAMLNQVWPMGTQGLGLRQPGVRRGGLKHPQRGHGGFGGHRMFGMGR